MTSSRLLRRALIDKDCQFELAGSLRLMMLLSERTIGTFDSSKAHCDTLADESIGCQTYGLPFERDGAACVVEKGQVEKFSKGQTPDWSCLVGLTSPRRAGL